VPGLPELRGRVDLVVATQDDLIITDWKTSRSRWSEQQFEDATDQLVLYAELIQHWLPRRNLRLDFVILTKSNEAALDHVSVPWCPSLAKRTKQVVATVWRALQGGHFYPTPSPLACSGCSFRAACRRWGS